MTGKNIKPETGALYKNAAGKYFIRNASVFTADLETRFFVIRLRTYPAFLLPEVRIMA